MKSELTIIKGQEFKISVKDSIKEDDIFIEQYKQAASMLNTILEKNQEDEDEYEKEYPWQQTEYENNIIAFCGERGDGKSSAMLTFINAIYKRDKDKKDDNKGIDIFKEYENIKKSYISKPIVIDPSQFDNVHNILDIILAKMYQRFYEKYKKDTRENDEKRTQELLNSFQKVYRQVAMINNQEKMLDDEFDCEGNIGKLSKLGESTNLKKNFKKLIGQYLAFMRNGNENPGNQLLVAIDDLDLCNTAAYKMAEQIRKYLILPNVVIVMAVKIDQLELAMREQNIKEYKDLINWTKGSSTGGKIELDNEIYNMGERYVSKLVPKARRIYMTKVQNIGELNIVYRESETDGGEQIYEGNSLVDTILRLIREKTGMIFVPEDTGMSYLVPNNLRDIVNWIVQLGSMEEPTKPNEIESEEKKQEIEEERKRIYVNNVEKFYQIIKWDWMNRELPVDIRSVLNMTENMDIVHMNANIKDIIEAQFANYRERKEGIFNKTIAPEFVRKRGERIVECFEILDYLELFYKYIVETEKNKIAYAIKCIYTCKFNQLLWKEKLFGKEGLNGYVWGDGFLNTLPGAKVDENRSEIIDRSRFVLNAHNEYMEILNYVSDDEEIKNSENYMKISQLNSKKERREYITSWILMALFANTFKENVRTRNGFISGNHLLITELENSIENYLVGLGDLDSLYNKINIGIIGVGEEDEDYKEIIHSIKENNQKAIICAQKIAANTDVSMKIKEWCYVNRDYKESTESPKERSEKIIDLFFSNIVKYINSIENGEKEENNELKINDLKLLKMDDANNAIDISQLYACLVEEAVREVQQKATIDIEKKIDNFRNKITQESSKYRKNARKVPGSLRDKSAKHAMDSLDYLGDNIQRYRGLKNKWPDDLKVEELCGFYAKIVQMALESKELDKEICDEYEKIAEIDKKMEKDLKAK